MKTQKPLKITMYCDGFPFDGNTLEDSSLGGTETAALQCAQTFADMGHEVIMVNHCLRPGNYKGVKYVNAQEFQKYFIEEKHDVSLVIRHPELFTQKHNSKVNILWQHDLAFVNDKERFLDHIWNIDSVWCQSNFHRNQYQSVMGLSEDLFWAAGSAIDPDLFPKEDIPRDKKKLIYTGRPERGLEVLAVDIMPKLLEHDPELKLYITTYDNFPQNILDLIAGIKRQTEGIKNNLIWLPPLTKKELYKQFQDSYLYLYPVTSYDKTIGNFEETYCLSIDECMAAGLPFISRPVGAISETLHSDAGVLVEGESNRDPEFQDRFVQTIIDLLNDDKRHKNMSEIGKIIALKEDTWNVRVNGFIEKINGLIDDFSQEKMSVCVLARPEDKSYLTRCLKSIKRIGDSVSSSVVKVCDRGQSERELLNQAIEDSSDDWFLWLYASEEIQNPEQLGKYIRKNIFDGYQIEKSYVHPEGKLDLMEDVPSRIFRKRNSTRFIGDMFPRLPRKILNEKHNIKDINIIDFSKEKVNINKMESYLNNGFSSIDKEFFLMKINLARAVEEINKACFITEAGENYCNKVIDLYHQKYEENLDSIGIDAVRMYSEANRILGKGFYYKMNSQAFRSDRDRRNSAFELCFSSKVDMKKFINLVMDRQVDQLQDKYYLVK